MAKSTPAQTFKRIFDTWAHPSTEPEVRANAERKLDAWLKRYGKTHADFSAILAQAAADNAAAAPPPPPSDPRDAQSHPFEDPQFTPAGLVHGIAGKYLAMSPHVATVYALWICLTHVQGQFRIAPRIALISEQPDSGKTTALDVARCLVLRPNPEALGTGAAVADFLDEGPCTVLLDEVDHIDKDARRDNVRGLLAIADACSPEWGRRARDVVTVLLAKERAERPEITFIRHGLAIFAALGLEQIGSVDFNRELRRLDLPDARWTRYRGASGLEYAHPIEMHEQAALGVKVGIESKQLWPPGKRERGGKFRGYTLAQFEEAWRRHGAVAPGGGEPRYLHLVPPE